MMNTKTLLGAACIAALTSPAFGQVQFWQDFEDLDVTQITPGENEGDPDVIVNDPSIDTNDQPFLIRPTRSGSSAGLFDLPPANAMQIIDTDSNSGGQALKVTLQNTIGQTVLNPDTLEEEFVPTPGLIGRAIVNTSGSSSAPNFLISGTSHVGMAVKIAPEFAPLNLELSMVFDDPSTGDATVPKPLIADGNWHFFQWDLSDDSQITTFDELFGSSGLGDGVISGAQVSVDSWVIKTPSFDDDVAAILGDEDAQIEFFVDSLAFNETGDLSELIPSQGIVGDLNGDGFVGAGDLDILLGVWNQNVSGVAADLNTDGFIGAGDLDILLGNWNAGTPPTPAAGVVPEPASLALLGVGGLAMLRRRR